MCQKKGFSLVELLVGIGLMGVLLATANVLLFSALRSVRKAAASGQARTEGAAAINNMVAMIRYSDSLTSGCSNSISIVRSNGDDITYSLSVSGTDRWIASDSSRIPRPIRLTSSRVVVTACPGLTLFSCPDPRSVNICFVAAAAGSVDVSDAQSITFKSQVTLRTLGQ